eukprot:TRINITY_DN3757_c0_g1_i2.p2 TRINITY_DN3757_c0_g1~~TRINITY_DN3757_c0_g1_i2.p2  ORF type:complete len:186 (-),score=17.57 TRINITY_DN3757_c0_g1_i2:244-801(-)
MPASRRVVDLSPTPFGTGCQTLEGVGVKVWVETLQNELRDQMKHWAKNNGGTNPLEEPLPRSLSDSFSLKSCPKNLPRSDPPLTKVPIQIRDPTYTVMDSTGVPVRRDRLGRPAPAPKFYSGAIQRHAAPPRRFTTPCMRTLSSSRSGAACLSYHVSLGGSHRATGRETLCSSQESITASAGTEQ